MKAVINAKIIHNDKILNGYTLLFDEKIISLSRGTLPGNCEIVDAKGNYLSAGFVDMHIHGSGGADVMDATAESLEKISSVLLQSGTTSFVATTMTMKQEKIVDAIENVISNGSEISGAKVQGIHLEGPFINPLKSGAQDSEYIRNPNLEWIKLYLDHIRVITIAPELEGAEEFIRYLRKTHPDIILSIGHSDMDYEGARNSFDWGISHATHLFNAMPPLHHREPGIVGAVFDSDVSADIIADLVHTHPAILKITQRLKKDKLILITDAMRAGCMKNGMYDLGGQEVEVKDGKATLKNGVLAGSVLAMNKAVKNLIENSDASLIDAIRSVSSYPAERLGLPCGKLEQGYDADVVIFDSDIDIKMVFVDGKMKYSKI